MKAINAETLLNAGALVVLAIIAGAACFQIIPAANAGLVSAIVSGLFALMRLGGRSPSAPSQAALTAPADPTPPQQGA